MLKSRGDIKMSLFDKLFGTYSERELKRIYPIADSVMALEEQYAALSDDELRGKTAEFKKELQRVKALTAFCRRHLQQ